MMEEEWKGRDEGRGVEGKGQGRRNERHQGKGAAAGTKAKVGGRSCG